MNTLHFLCQLILSKGENCVSPLWNPHCLVSATSGGDFTNETGKRVPGASWTFGILALAFALFSPVGGTAQAAESMNPAGFCTATADATLKACRHEAADDYFLDLGNCNNLSTESARLLCRQEALTDIRSQAMQCLEQEEGRLSLCRRVGEAPYDPVIDPAMFVDPTEIGKSIAPNPYFPLIPGRTMVYRGGTETIEVTVSDTQTREIQGVQCAVVHDVVEDDGEITEDTIDWYAQDIFGNVWYFGEISQTLEDGILVSIDGSFTAGEEGAKAGIIMKAAPRTGETYRQEFALNDAEDAATVLTLTGTATTPAASCLNNCLITRDFSPLIPDLLEYKFYARGVGFILEFDPVTRERLQLVEIRN